MRINRKNIEKVYTREDVETYDALVALQYNGEHFRSKFKRMAKRSRNKGVGRVLYTGGNGVKITLRMDTLNQPELLLTFSQYGANGATKHTVPMFSFKPDGVVWHGNQLADYNPSVPWAVLRMVNDVFEYYCNYTSGRNYRWRRNGFFRMLNDSVSFDDIDRVKRDAGIVTHNISVYGRPHEYRDDDGNPIPHDKLNCELCVLIERIQVLRDMENKATLEVVEKVQSISLNEKIILPWGYKPQFTRLPYIVEGAYRRMVEY